MHTLHGGPPGATYALYGAREALLHAPLQFADEAAIGAFIDPWFKTVGGQEIFRLALIAQGTAALSGPGLHGQVVRALKTGVLRAAPVPVSGHAPPPTEPAKAELSGKPFVMPPRINPLPTPPPPEPQRKLAVEISGKTEGRSPLEIHSRPLGRSAPLQHLSGFDSGTDPQRTQLEVHGLTDTPHQLTLSVPLTGGGAMELPLGTSLTPVEKSLQKKRWETVLVRIVPFIYMDAEHTRARAALTPEGWLVMFVNGYLHREWWSNGQGMFRDVNLGARDGVGDNRVARGQPQDHLLAPGDLNGQQQKVELLYSRQMLSWATLMKLGGIAPDDARFSAAEKQRAAAIAVDEDLRKQFLVTLDLSGHADGFPAESGAIGPVAKAPVWPVDYLDRRRGSGIAVAYLAPVFRKKQVIVVLCTLGIFSGRLEAQVYVWDLDDTDSLVENYAKGKLLTALMARDWADKEIKLKTDRLHTPGAKIMTGHAPNIKKEVLKKIKTGRDYQDALRQAEPDADPEAVAESVYQRRSARGWYGANSDYTSLYEAIEAIEDEHFVFRVQVAAGDWRNDLRAAADHLKKQTERIQAETDYPELGIKGVHYEAGMHQVIAVTHSQGGLIERYSSEVSGARGLIQGIIHLNQPTTGAPVLYQRFLGGVSVERVVPFSLSRIKDNIFTEILGPTSHHFTRMAGPMAGASCLLPASDYAHRPGAKPGDWLHCPPRGFKPEVITDVFKELYPHDKVGLISHKRYDADGKPKPYSAQEFMKVRFAKKISAAVQQTLSKMSGMMKEFMTGQATAWKDGPVHDFKPGEIPDDATYYLPENTLWHRCNMRLRLGQGVTEWDRKVAKAEYKKHVDALALAAAFEAALRNPDGSLKLHPKTYLISSTGKATVTQVRVVLKHDKNGDQILEFPYERSTDGDGTVPLSSQDALLAYGAKRAGPVITEGNVTHADICSHPQAIQQVKDAMTELVKALRPKDQESLFAPSPNTPPVRGEKA